MVEVMPLEAEGRPARRLGLLRGQISAPDDFDAFMQDEIIALFEDGPLSPSPNEDTDPSDAR